MKYLPNFKLLGLGFVLGLAITSFFFVCLFDATYINISSDALFLVNTIDRQEIPTPYCNPLKIDINHASVDDLSKLPGIGEVKAISILEFREKYGLFQEVDEMLFVNGIGKSIFENIKELVTICFN